MQWLVTLAVDSSFPASVQLDVGATLHQGTQPLGGDLPFHHVTLEPESNSSEQGPFEILFVSFVQRTLCQCRCQHCQWLLHSCHKLFPHNKLTVCQFIGGCDTRWDRLGKSVMAETQRKESKAS